MILGDYLLYLDPHTVQDTVKIKPNSRFPDKVKIFMRYTDYF